MPEPTQTEVAKLSTSSAPVLEAGPAQSSAAESPKKAPWWRGFSLSIGKQHVSKSNTGEGTSAAPPVQEPAPALNLDTAVQFHNEKPVIDPQQLNSAVATAEEHVRAGFEGTGQPVQPEDLLPPKLHFDDVSTEGSNNQPLQPDPNSMETPQHPNGSGGPTAGNTDQHTMATSVYQHLVASQKADSQLQSPNRQQPTSEHAQVEAPPLANDTEHGQQSSPLADHLNTPEGQTAKEASLAAAIGLYSNLTQPPVTDGETIFRDAQREHESGEATPAYDIPGTPEYITRQAAGGNYPGNLDTLRAAIEAQKSGGDLIAGIQSDIKRLIGEGKLHSTQTPEELDVTVAEFAKAYAAFLAEHPQLANDRVDPDIFRAVISSLNGLTADALHGVTGNNTPVSYDVLKKIDPTVLSHYRTSPPAEEKAA